MTRAMACAIKHARARHNRTCAAPPRASLVVSISSPSHARRSVACSLSRARRRPNPGVYPAYTTLPANKDQGFLRYSLPVYQPKMPISSVRSVYTKLTLPYLRHPRALGHGGGLGSYVLVRSAIYIFRIPAALVRGWYRGRHVWRREGWGRRGTLSRRRRRRRRRLIMRAVVRMNERSTSLRTARAISSRASFVSISSPLRIVLVRTARAPPATRRRLFEA